METLLGYVALFAFMGLVIYLSLLAHRLRADARTQICRRLAKRFGGQWNGDWTAGGPSFFFGHHGAWVRVQFIAANRAEALHMTVSWRDPTMRCEVYPAGFLSPLRKLVGLTDVEVGSPEFDRQYVVLGDPDRVRKLLSPEVQRAIERLRRLPLGRFFPSRQIRVSIGDGVLHIQKHGRTREARDVSEFVLAGLNLYRRAAGAGERRPRRRKRSEANWRQRPPEARPARPPTRRPTSAKRRTRAASPPRNDVEVVAAGAARPAICQVCGEAIAEQLVRCRRCDTPHHRDCWVYNGACSTYGCGEEEFVSLDAARYASDPSPSPRPDSGE